MATWGLIWCGYCVIPNNKACWNDCTRSHNKIFEYICMKFTNIQIYSYPNFSMVLIFEYIVFQFFYVRIRISNIRVFATLWLKLGWAWHNSGQHVYSCSYIFDLVLKSLICHVFHSKIVSYLKEICSCSHHLFHHCLTGNIFKTKKWKQRIINRIGQQESEPGWAFKL